VAILWQLLCKGRISAVIESDGVQGVGGSNPLVPTTHIQGVTGKQLTYDSKLPNFATYLPQAKPAEIRAAPSRSEVTCGKYVARK